MVDSILAVVTDDDAWGDAIVIADVLRPYKPDAVGTVDHWIAERSAVAVTAVGAMVAALACVAVFNPAVLVVARTVAAANTLVDVHVKCVRCAVEMMLR